MRIYRYLLLVVFPLSASDSWSTAGRRVNDAKKSENIPWSEEEGFEKCPEILGSFEQTLTGLSQSALTQRLRQVPQESVVNGYVVMSLLRCKIVSLARHGADVNSSIQFKSQEITPLSFAALQADTPLVRVLLKHGANPNVLVFGVPLLSFYLMRAMHDTKVLKMLIAAGADVNVQDKGGLRPLEVLGAFCASKYDHTKRTLIAKRARILVRAGAQSIEEAGELAFKSGLASKDATACSAFLECLADMIHEDVSRRLQE